MIATDDARIADAARGFGAEVEMTSSDCASGTDRVAEVARRRVAAEIVVNLQGDEPELDAEAVGTLIAGMRADPGIAMATLAHREHDAGVLVAADVVKVGVDDGGRALYFSRRAPSALDPKALVLRHVGVYGFRRDFLLEFASWPTGAAEGAERLEQLRAVERGVPIRVFECEVGRGRGHAGAARSTRASWAGGIGAVDRRAGGAMVRRRRKREGTVAKIIVVTGGVVSSLGKGIAAASLGLLLKARGLRVTIQKLDPYLNIDPGTMSPFQHGEVFVTDDGAETDLDLGHYERFTGVSVTRSHNVTAGQIYDSILSKERRGDYLGRTVQVIPHVTDEIKRRIMSLGLTTQADVHDRRDRRHRRRHRVAAVPRSGAPAPARAPARHAVRARHAGAVHHAPRAR